MKRLKYAILASLCVMMSVFLLSGCGGKTPAEETTENNAAIEADSITEVKNYTQQIADQLSANTYETYQAYIDADQVFISRLFDIDLAQRWKTFNEKHGEIQKAEVIETSKADNEYTCKIVLTGDDNEMMALTITYNNVMTPISSSIEDYTDDASQTIGMKMEQAGSNIVVGLGIVFLILIFLSLVISLFKYINKIGSKKAQPAPEAKRTAAPAAVTAAVPQDSTTNIPIQDNSELVAVISAAIAASEGTASANGYVVRSIRRLDSNKWR